MLHIYVTLHRPNILLRVSSTSVGECVDCSAWTRPFLPDVRGSYSVYPNSHATHTLYSLTTRPHHEYHLGFPSGEGAASADD